MRPWGVPGGCALHRSPVSIRRVPRTKGSQSPESADTVVGLAWCWAPVFEGTFTVPTCSTAFISVPSTSFGETQRGAAEEQLREGYPNRRCAKGAEPWETPSQGSPLDTRAMPSKTSGVWGQSPQQPTQNPEVPISCAIWDNQ